VLVLDCKCDVVLDFKNGILLNCKCDHVENSSVEKKSENKKQIKNHENCAIGKIIQK